MGSQLDMKLTSGLLLALLVNHVAGMLLATSRPAISRLISASLPRHHLVSRRSDSFMARRSFHENALSTVKKEKMMKCKKGKKPYYPPDLYTMPNLLDAIRMNDKPVIKYLLFTKQYSRSDRDARGNDAISIAAGYPIGRSEPHYHLLRKLLDKYEFRPTFNELSPLNHPNLWAKLRGDRELMSILDPYVSIEDREAFVWRTSLDRWFQNISLPSGDSLPPPPRRTYPRHYKVVKVRASREELRWLDSNGNDALWRACGYPIGRSPDYPLVYTLLQQFGMDPDRPNPHSHLSILLAWAIQMDDLELVLLLYYLGRCDVRARLKVHGEQYLEKVSLSDSLVQEMTIFIRESKISTSIWNDYELRE